MAMLILLSIYSQSQCFSIIMIIIEVILVNLSQILRGAGKEPQEEGSITMFNSIKYDFAVILYTNNKHFLIPYKYILSKKHNKLDIL